ncbi:MAG: MBL fold metallo-hydrolase [Alicyclobacillaceae bacterium]|nr:MBL fold metallo-hydrolase [Alicyclobacillaceae bacterium]
MVRFSVLASGSSGNAVFVQAGSTRLLIDAGISGRQLDARLRQAAGIGLSDVDAIFVTHEHVDHVRGLEQVLKRTRADAPVYLTDGTQAGLGPGCRDLLQPRARRIRHGVPVLVGDLTVTPVSVSHDAEEPVALRLDGVAASLGILTDTGYVSDAVLSVMAGCRAYIWESNHDVDMLRTGPYPWNVKRRILGDKGHLSNADSASALAEVTALTSGQVDVYLAHLSAENNRPALALAAAEQMIGERGEAHRRRVKLHVAGPDAPTPLHTLSS